MSACSTTTTPSSSMAIRISFRSTIHGARRIEQCHELPRQDPAAERKKLGDQDVGPNRLQRVEQDGSTPVEIGIVDRLQCVVEQCPEIRTDGLHGWKLDEGDVTEIGQAGGAPARDEHRLMTLPREGARQGRGPGEVAGP